MFLVEKDNKKKWSLVSLNEIKKGVKGKGKSDDFRIYTAVAESEGQRYFVKFCCTGQEISKKQLQYEAHHRYRHRYICYIDHACDVTIEKEKQDSEDVFKNMKSKEDGFCIFEEYAEDGTVHDYYKKDKDLVNFRLALRHMYQMSHALNGFYNDGQIHRDIKPQNFGLAENYKLIKLFDFDISHALQTMGNAEHNEHRVGITPYYVSREQYLNNFSTDIRNDIYSLAMTYLYMLCGENYIPKVFPVRAGEKAGDYLKRYISDDNAMYHLDRKAAASRYTDIDDELLDIIEKMMQSGKDMQGYSDPYRICRDLEKYIVRRYGKEVFLEHYADSCILSKNVFARTKRESTYCEFNNNAKNIREGTVTNYPDDNPVIYAYMINGKIHIRVMADQYEILKGEMRDGIWENDILQIKVKENIYYLERFLGGDKKL